MLVASCRSESLSYNKQGNVFNSLLRPVYPICMKKKMVFFGQLIYYKVIEVFLGQLYPREIRAMSYINWLFSCSYRAVPHQPSTWVWHWNPRWPPQGIILFDVSRRSLNQSDILILEWNIITPQQD